MQRRPSALTFIEILIIIAVIAAVIALLLPLKRNAREAARRNSCMNNLKQIALAIHAYEEEHGTLPPAYTVDKEGNQLHSWRTLILPYLEQTALFKTIDLAKPWDDPVNAKARETIVEVYQCPSKPGPNGLTNYLAVVGPECAFVGSEPRKLSDVKDGSETTIAIIDVGTDRTIPWMSPNDISPDELLQYLPTAKMNHLGLALSMYLDASVRSINQDIDPEVLNGLLTIAGGEKMEF